MRIVYICVVPILRACDRLALEGLIDGVLILLAVLLLCIVTFLLYVYSIILYVVLYTFLQKSKTKILMSKSSKDYNYV